MARLSRSLNPHQPAPQLPADAWGTRAKPVLRFLGRHLSLPRAPGQGCRGLTSNDPLAGKPPPPPSFSNVTAVHSWRVRAALPRCPTHAACSAAWWDALHHAEAQALRLMKSWLDSAKSGRFQSINRSIDQSINQ